MVDDAKNPKLVSRASPQTQDFVARRREARRAMAADRERARAEQATESDDDEPNRAGFVLGLIVVAALCLGGWFIVDQMRCNPLFSNISFAQARSCR